MTEIEDIKRVYEEEGKLTVDLIASIADASEKEYAKMGKVTTVCVLTTPAGIEVVGTSAVISEDKFNFNIGKQVAFQKAKEKLWDIYGAILKVI